MPHLPACFAGIILSFVLLFVHRSWRHAQALLIGAILCPARRTVASVLWITGRARERHFVNTHRVLSAPPDRSVLELASCSGYSSKPSRRAVLLSWRSMTRSNGAGDGASGRGDLP